MKSLGGGGLDLILNIPSTINHKIETNVLYHVMLLILNIKNTANTHQMYTLSRRPLTDLQREQCVLMTLLKVRVYYTFLHWLSFVLFNKYSSEIVF